MLHHQGSGGSLFSDGDLGQEYNWHRSLHQPLLGTRQGAQRWVEPRVIWPCPLQVSHWSPVKMKSLLLL